LKVFLALNPIVLLAPLNPIAPRLLHYPKCLCINISTFLNELVRGIVCIMKHNSGS